MNSDLLPNFYPVFTESSKALFLEHPSISETTVVLEDVCFQTKPLRTDVEINLIGISSTNELLQKGIIDNTDHLHPEIRLKALYFAVQGQNKIAKMEVADVYSFDKTSEGNFRELELEYTHSVSIPARSLADAFTENNEATCRLAVSLSGMVNIETGQMRVSGTSKIIAAPADLYNKEVQVVGYELEYSRDNLNRRPR